MSTRKPQAKEEVSRANDFHSLGLAKHLVEALERSEIKSPTKIQAESIPVLMQGKDLIAQAKTGSGKTLAFALPALDKIKNQKSTHTLVLTPTRELAQQVTNVFKQYSRQTKINIACVVGKESYTSQIESIRKGAQVVVATPGRLLDLLETKKINKFSPETVVFDEADEMLNMGFIDDIKSILKFIPEKRQTVFFSATFPQAIIKLAKMEQVNPISIRMDNEREKSSPLIEQHFFVIKNEEKKNAIIRLFEMNNPHKAIIFCRTKGDTEVLQNHFINKNFKAKALHGDLSQQDRKRAVNNFKDGSYNILIATDIASRGLDIDDLSHVFNYDLPENYDRYTHRIGRTGRAGKKGEAFTFTTKSEWRSNSFLRHVDMKNIKLAEIPNKEKVEKIALENLNEEIKTTKISPESKVLIEKILEDHNSEDLICKLITLVNSKKKISGPEYIGLPQKRLDQFVSEIKRTTSKSRKVKDFENKRSNNKRRPRKFWRERKAS